MNNVSEGDTEIMDNMDNTSKCSGGGEPRSPATSNKYVKGTKTTSRKRIVESQIITIMRQAQTFQELGHFDEAIELGQQILESGFERPDVRYFLGWLYEQQQRWNDAIDQFQRLLNDPDFALSCYYELGRCYREGGHLHTATTYFDGAVERVDIDSLTIEEADQLVELFQETADAHYQLGEQEQAHVIMRILLDFLHRRGWSEQLVQVEFMHEQLQSNLPSRPRLQLASAPVPSQMQKHVRFQHMRQWVMRHVSLPDLFQRKVARHPLRSQWLWGMIIILLLIGVSLGSTGIWSYVIHQHSQVTSATMVRPSRTALHPSATASRTISPTPSSATSVTIANSYYGLLHDIPTGLTTNISFTKIQQHQDSISGYFGGMPTNGTFNAIPRNGSFTGTINTSKHIQIILKTSTGQSAFSFDGQVTTDNRIVGTYCNVSNITGKCSDYGLWSISPRVP